MRLGSDMPEDRDHGLTVSETVFEVLPLHEVVDITPIPRETKVVPPSGGLNTETTAVPGRTMSAVIIPATNWRLLMNVVTRKEPFQLTKEFTAEIVAVNGQ